MLESSHQRRREQYRSLAPTVLHTTITDGHDRVRVTLEGEVDMAGESRLAAALTAAEGHDAGEVVVDLSGLRFMDSSGVEALMALQHRLSLDHRRLTVVPGPPGVQRIFAICGLAETMGFRG